MQLILKVLDPLDEMIQTKYQNDYQDCVIVFSSVYRFDNKLIQKPTRLHMYNKLVTSKIPTCILYNIEKKT